jgi:hypothetical protein
MNARSTKATVEDMGNMTMEDTANTRDTRETKGTIEQTAF